LYGSLKYSQVIRLKGIGHPYFTLLQIVSKPVWVSFSTAEHKRWYFEEYG